MNLKLQPDLREQLGPVCLRKLEARSALLQGSQPWQMLAVCRHSDLPLLAVPGGPAAPLRGRPGPQGGDGCLCSHVLPGFEGRMGAEAFRVARRRTGCQQHVSVYRLQRDASDYQLRQLWQASTCLAPSDCQVWEEARRGHLSFFEPAAGGAARPPRLQATRGGSASGCALLVFLPPKRALPPGADISPADARAAGRRGRFKGLMGRVGRVLEM